MKYIIIGLGNYGNALAVELTAMGHEVVGADMQESHIEKVKDIIATAIQVDATDEEAMGLLPLQEADVVIVAIGESFGASIKVVALLKKKKVRSIYARAIDDLHRSILEAFNLDKILTPEEDSAREVVQMIDFGKDVDTFRVGGKYYVMRFKVPEKMVGFEVNDLQLEERYNLKLICLKRGNRVENSLGISAIEHEELNVIPKDIVIKEDDELVCYGRLEDFKQCL